MKRVVGIVFVLVAMLTQPALAQNEIGPEGGKLYWLLLIILLPFAIILLNSRYERKNGAAFKGLKNLNWFGGSSKRRLDVALRKDQKYNPTRVKLIIRNTGNQAIDLAPPLLSFNGLFTKRSFLIKSVNGQLIYPLYLEPGREHKIDINLQGFYNKDKKLKSFGFVKLSVKDVKGRRFNAPKVRVNKYLFF
ncbi:hypothetical protein EYV94_11250 [Puteibacter caeruleilacunae]|nr:hypothetical protein EYV94_11250 [Puteibacter caeruleilacunae]